MSNQTNIPEAVASVTYSVTSKNGFNALFTVRGESGTNLLEAMETIETVLKDKRYVPQVKQSFGGGVKKEVSFVEGKTCPKDGGKLIKAFSKTGKEYHKCENGKYDFATKQTSGCTYVDWLNPPKPTTPMTVGEFEASQAPKLDRFDDYQL